MLFVASRNDSQKHPILSIPDPSRFPLPSCPASGRPAPAFSVALPGFHRPDLVRMGVLDRNALRLAEKRWNHIRLGKQPGLSNPAPGVSGSRAGPDRLPELGVAQCIVSVVGPGLGASARPIVSGRSACLANRSRPGKEGAEPRSGNDRLKHLVHYYQGSQMANPHPTPKLENLRPPWTPGTSGNPAGYSRGRRISDTIERQIEEMALDREFGATAIAMALGKKYMLKHKVKDPETGDDVWVEHKPDIAWFKMILERIEPVAKQTDDGSVLDALADDDDSELPAPVDQSKASECLERSRSDPCDCNENVESAGKLFQGVPARVGSGQVAPQGPPDASSRRRSRHDLGGRTTVRPSPRADPARSSRAVQSGPACRPAPCVP